MERPRLELLMAEDMEDDALLTVDALSQQFSVSWERVQTAETMRQALRGKHWDLVIADWQMPVFNALQALQIAHEADPNLPFIIVSGTVDEDVAVHAMEIGAHDYLIKDNLTRLNAAVTRELREASIRRQYAHVADELERRAEELYRSNLELERFAYVAAHDLREPLRMVTSYSELLVRLAGSHIPDTQEAETVVGFIRDGVDRMERLIQGLLSYSKVVHDVDQDLKPVDSNSAVREALQHLETAIRDARATITVGDLPAVRADHTQLLQIFQNLLSNAIKYRRAGVPPEIRISAGTEDGNQIFVIHDNGIGIAAEHHERIFHIFKRLHRDEYPGVGIGLALTRRLVEMHGGRIWVKSEPGLGSAFCFSLPAIGEPAANTITQGFVHG